MIKLHRISIQVDLRSGLTWDESVQEVKETKGSYTWEGRRFNKADLCVISKWVVDHDSVSFSTRCLEEDAPLMREKLYVVTTEVIYRMRDSINELVKHIEQ